MTKRPTQRTSSRTTICFARHLRQDMTAVEQCLWERLRNRSLGGFKFRRQHPLGPYIADFYCAEKRFVLEIDGEIHSLPWQRYKDRLRDHAIRRHDIIVFRARNEEVLTDLDGFLQRLLSQMLRL